MDEWIHDRNFVHTNIDGNDVDVHNGFKRLILNKRDVENNVIILRILKNE